MNDLGTVAIIWYSASIRMQNHISQFFKESCFLGLLLIGSYGMSLE